VSATTAIVGLHLVDQNPDCQIKLTRSENILLRLKRRRLVFNRKSIYSQRWCLIAASHRPQKPDPERSYI